MPTMDSIPEKLTAGDTWRWTVAFADYPAPTWIVTYTFRNASASFSAQAAADGTSHAVTIAAATSAAIIAGRYQWTARAVSGSIVETIDSESGWVEILPDSIAGQSRDMRSWAQRALDAVKATIEGTATSAQQTFSIGGRSVSLMSWSELRRKQVDLENDVAREAQSDRLRTRGVSSARVLVRG